MNTWELTFLLQCGRHWKAELSQSGTPQTYNFIQYLPSRILEHIIRHPCGFDVCMNVNTARIFIKDGSPMKHIFACCKYRNPRVEAQRHSMTIWRTSDIMFVIYFWKPQGPSNILKPPEDLHANDSLFADLLTRTGLSERFDQTGMTSSLDTA